MARNMTRRRPSCGKRYPQYRAMEFSGVAGDRAAHRSRGGVGRSGRVTAENGMRGLTGKRVIVTGGGSGIGRATVQRLVEEGCEVGIFDIDEAGAATTADLCAGDLYAGGARVFRTDIADRASVEQSAAAFERDVGPADLLANVAGWDRMMNFLVPTRCSGTRSSPSTFMVRCICITLSCAAWRSAGSAAW